MKWLEIVISIPHWNAKSIAGLPPEFKWLVTVFYTSVGGVRHCDSETQERIKMTLAGPKPGPTEIKTKALTTEPPSPPSYISSCALLKSLQIQ